ncbi:uncharacterized [Tachysurus ichikawai]
MLAGLLEKCRIYTRLFNYANELTPGHAWEDEEEDFEEDEEEDFEEDEEDSRTKEVYFMFSASGSDKGYVAT